MQTIEIYGLIGDRKLSSAESFLHRFLPFRKPSQEDYGVPLHSDAHEHVYTDEHAILSHLADYPSEPYSLYWYAEDPDNPISQAMLFHTEDGMMIAGLVVDPDIEVVLEQVAFLRAHTGNDGVLLRLDEGPPDTGLEFTRQARFEALDVPGMVKMARI